MDWIAREAAATFRKGVPSAGGIRNGNDENVNDYIKVTVKDTELARDTARVVKNIRLGLFPEGMQRQLIICGTVRSMHLVDITNPMG